LFSSVRVSTSTAQPPSPFFRIRYSPSYNTVLSELPVMSLNKSVNE